MQAVRDLELLIGAAQEAGDIARSYFDGANKVWDKPGGAGPVSEADLAVDTLLRERLTSARPGYGWLSEETEDTSHRQDTDSVFIVDPIDGTRSFIEGSGTWAHSLAIAKHGQITAAVVYMPVKGSLYAAHKGGGAQLNGQPLSSSSSATLNGASVLAARPTMDAGNWAGGVPQIKRHYRPSLAYRLCLVAEGRFDAMLTLRPSWEWDIAAGALILSEAGARVSDRTGQALQFNNPIPQTNGIVASGAGMHRELISALSVG